MAKIDAKALLEAGVHFGHRTDKWNPKMKPFIYEARNGIHIINLSKTSDQIEAAAKFLRSVASEGGKILFVGCKKASQEAVKETASRANAFYVCERWLGGTLTNLNTIRKSVARMREIDAMEGGKFKEMPKQEVAALRREVAKLHKNLDGIQNMERQPDAMVIVDITREEIALKEAQRLKIPVVAITDTNADPELVQFPIPANDDAIRSIRIVLQSLGDAIVEGANAGGKKRGGKEETRTAESLAGVSA
jgi:small subunit ribosomal protein S2